jgi:ribose transport system permease protein
MGTVFNRNISFKKSVKWLFSMREFTLVLMIAIMFIIIPVFQPVFATKNNVITTLLSIATKGIVGIGITLILISGALDLSVGAMVALIAAVFGRVYHMTDNMTIGILAGLAVGLAGGTLNGVLVTKCNLSAFISTLATQGIFRGLTFVLTKGTPLKLTDVTEGYKQLGFGKLFGVPYVVLMFLALAIIAHILLKSAKILRKNVYTGSNAKAAKFSGVDTGTTVLVTYSLIGVLCWIAAQMSVARFCTASPTTGNGWETELISAAVIGGATLDGGNGSIIGTALGLVLLGFVASAIQQLGVSVYWQDFISYFILLVAVLFDSVVESRKHRTM